MKKREYPTRSILFFHSSKVGMRRLELPTSTSRTWRASQLCYIPFLITGAKIQLFFEMQIFFVLFFIEITTIENAIENDQLISVCLYYFVVIYFQISIFELLKTT